MGKVNVYDVGGGGVNLVKNPLQMGDNESTQLQNAEFIPDQSSGGQGALSKRGGLQALNSSSLGGAISGMAGLPLQTTFTRTLYASLASRESFGDTDAWSKTSNGTSWTNISTPEFIVDPGKYGLLFNEITGPRRIVSFKTSIYYPGTDYVFGTGNPTVYGWDNNINTKIADIYPGPDCQPSAPSRAILDMIVANQKIYMVVLDDSTSGAVEGGRVLALDPIAGTITQVANTIKQVTGGTAHYPGSLCWYQDQLWLTVSNDLSNAANGRIYRCYPDVDSTWTSDVTNLGGQPCSMAEFKGDLYVGTVATDTVPVAYIYKRSASTGAYTIQQTGSSSTGSHYKSLYVFNNELYAAVFNATTPSYYIVKSSDGTIWSNDRDLSIDGVISGGVLATGLVGNMLEYNSDLYVGIQNITNSAEPSTDQTGFVLRRHSGSWSKVSPDDAYTGSLAILVERT